MKTTFIIAKHASDISQVPEDKKPCYFLVLTENNPQLSYLSKYEAPLKVAFNQYDLLQFKAKANLTTGIEYFMRGEQSIAIKELSTPQRKLLFELTGHIPLTYSQNRIIERINLYLSKNKQTVRANTGGICMGLAAIYCAYESEGKEEEFFQRLKELSTCKIADLKNNESEVSRFIQRVIDAFNPHTFDKNSAQGYWTERVRVNNPNKEDKAPPNSSLKSAFLLNACASNRQWGNILDKINVEKTNYQLIIPYHAISMSYREGQFRYYDPNSSRGLRFYKTQEELLNKISRTIAKVQMYAAEQTPGVKVAMSIIGSTVELEYKEGKYFLHQNPGGVKTFNSREQLQGFIRTEFINKNRFLIDLSINVIENPYYPNPDFKPKSSKGELLTGLMRAGDEFSLKETIVRAIANNDAEFAEGLLGELVDMRREQIQDFCEVAFRNNSFEWLIKILNDPKVKDNHDTRVKILGRLYHRPELLANDKSLKIVLEHPSIASMLLDDAFKIKWLESAVTSKNPNSVEVLLNYCTKEERAKFVDDRLIYAAVGAGRLETLELLLNYKKMDEDLARSCFEQALIRLDLRMAHFFLQKYPEYKLLNSVRLMNLDEEHKSALMEKALISRNEDSVKLVVSMCSEKEREVVLGNQTLFDAIKQGYIPSLEVLLSKRTIDKTTAEACLGQAALSNNLDTINYLLNKFPKYELAKSFPISAELISTHHFKFETLELLKEKGAPFVASSVLNTPYSPEATAIPFAIYKYADDPNPNSFADIRSSMTPFSVVGYMTKMVIDDKTEPPATVIDFLVKMVRDEKIEPVELMKHIIANNDPNLGVGLIKELHRQWAIDPQIMKAVEQFLETMIQQKNNKVLKDFLDLNPPLPLNYSELYKCAKAELDLYQSTRWPSMLTFASVPDPMIVERLKTISEIHSAENFNKSTISILKAQPESSGEYSEQEELEPSSPDSKEEKSSLVELNSEEKIAEEEADECRALRMK